MKTFPCSCGNQLFFENIHCVACGLETGFCPCCWRVTSLVPAEQGLACGHSDCGASLQKCHNYLVENICNGLVEANPDQPDALCEFCRTTTAFPDMSIEGNREKWARLEAAKRRVLYALRWLGLPIGTESNGVLPLTFEFLADAEKPVFTGHDSGRITVNIREADDVEREKTRVEFGEPQRTLIGHIRHELGHYYWDVLVKDRKLDEFRQVFGDESHPSYEEALQTYYKNGPAPDPQGNFISGYASMHPWEDFAETFNAYLDMVSILDTANHLDIADFRHRDCSRVIGDYQQVGIRANEINREMGLKDLVPEVFSPAVTGKLCFLHALVSDLTSPAAAPVAAPAVDVSVAPAPVPASV